MRRQIWQRGTAAAIGFVILLGPTVPALADDEFVPNPQPHSAVVDWVEAMLLAIEANPPAPTATTWRMWVVMSSIYDAWAAYDSTAAGTATGYSLKGNGRDVSQEARREAVSHAAYRALTHTYPNQKELFAEVLGDLGYEPDDSTDRSTPAGIGSAAAEAVITLRSEDGSNASNGFADVTSEHWPELYVPRNSADPDAPNGIRGPDFDPNAWQPLRVPTGTVLDSNGNPVVDPADPGSYVDQSFLTPHWGAVKPFALVSGDQFRPQPPPEYGSTDPYTDALGNTATGHHAWLHQVHEAVDLSAGLTDTQKVIAEFWADGPHTWTPPGHWVQIAIGISIRDGHDLGEDARMFMALTGSLLDAGVVAWDAKRAYDFIRPVSAIAWYYEGETIRAWAGPNLGTRPIDGADWQPYQAATFVTPPFAEYISGHSTFSRSAREVLRTFAGSDALYDGSTRLGRDYDGDGTEDLMGRHVAEPGSMMFEEGPGQTVVLQWDTMAEAADEAGISRRLGGIHFQDGDLLGRQAGALVGNQAFARAKLHWDPFGELEEQVVDLASNGELTTRAARELTTHIVAAGRVALKNETAGCSALDRVKGVLGRSGKLGGVSDQARDRVDGQLEVVAGFMCR